MTNEEAYQRARKAVLKADKDSDAFDHGGMSSGDILITVLDALKAEFRKGKRP